MRRFSLGAFAVGVAGCGAGPEPSEETEVSAEPVIFGADERLDHGAMAANEQSRAQAVAVHVLSPGLSCAAGTCTLTTQPFTNSPEGGRLCETVRFRNQLWATQGNCTAWLVGPNLLATAGHCISSSTCASARYIFGFHAAANGGNVVTSFPEANVYSCSSVVARVYNGNAPTNQDYALVRLDRNVSGRAPVIVRHTGQVPNSEQVHAYGHPSALPLKLTRNMWIQDNTFTERFFGNGDVFGGNSGGPVWNTTNWTVEGIVVTQPVPRFVTSTDSQGTCSQYRVCPDTGCSNPSDVTLRLTGSMRINRVPGIPLHTALVHASYGI
jgi:V8-like Glu-specific endopeptidase